MALSRIGAGRFVSESVEDTMEFGRLMAGEVRDGDVLVLTGGLGVGKTHLTKGLSAGLGDTHPVTSPTFALMAVHDGGRIPLFHFDLYRLEHAYELEDTGVYDVLGYEGVCVLEWGEQFQDELTDEFLSVVIQRDPEDETRRLVSLEPHGVRAQELARDIDLAAARIAGGPDATGNGCN